MPSRYIEAPDEAGEWLLSTSTGFPSTRYRFRTMRRNEEGAAQSFRLTTLAFGVSTMRTESSARTGRLTI